MSVIPGGYLEIVVMNRYQKDLCLQAQHRKRYSFDLFGIYSEQKHVVEVRRKHMLPSAV